MFGYLADLTLSYAVLAITCFVILYRFSKLIKERNLWGLLEMRILMNGWSVKDMHLSSINGVAELSHIK